MIAINAAVLQKTGKQWTKSTFVEERESRKHFGKHSRRELINAVLYLNKPEFDEVFFFVELRLKAIKKSVCNMHDGLCGAMRRDVTPPPYDKALIILSIRLFHGRDKMTGMS